MSMPNATAPKKQPIQILVVENSPAEARLTVEALKEAGMHDGVISLPSGDEALAYLRREGEHAGKSTPHLIFLDLHLPKTPGLVVLSLLKEDPEFKAIPVVVVSGSHDAKEIREAYQLHANCVVYKSLDLKEFLYFIRSCYEFWGSVVMMPPPQL